MSITGTTQTARPGAVHHGTGHGLWPARRRPARNAATGHDAYVSTPTDDQRMVRSSATSAAKTACITAHAATPSCAPEREPRHDARSLTVRSHPVLPGLAQPRGRDDPRAVRWGALTHQVQTSASPL